jgi:hypothetical protein
MRTSYVWLREVAYKFWKTWKLSDRGEVRLCLWPNEIDEIGLNALG